MSGSQKLVCSECDMQARRLSARGLCERCTRLTYIIRMVEPQRRHVHHFKIGRSTENGLQARLKTLQTGNPYKLEFARIISGDHEWRLHDHFRASRRVGEWFFLTDDEVLHALPEHWDWEWSPTYVWDTRACRNDDECWCPRCAPNWLQMYHSRSIERQLREVIPDIYLPSAVDPMRPAGVVVEG